MAWSLKLCAAPHERWHFHFQSAHLLVAAVLGIGVDANIACGDRILPFRGRDSRTSENDRGVHPARQGEALND